MSVSRYPVLWIFVLVVLIMPFLTPYLPMAWYVEHGLMENLQCALLGLAAFGCLYGYTRMQAQTDRWVWLGMAMVFLVFVVRETNMMRGVLYDADAIWFGVHNRLYGRTLMGVMAMAALSSLASAADIGLVAIDWVSICGRAWRFGLGDMGIILEENSELLVYVGAWLICWHYGKLLLTDKPSTSKDEKYPAYHKANLFK
ncbi:hypothetical protein [Moraxella ovis]|uniref:hypothetical protein n=1 Tax=Moraxella ovis TaxID=29433 RepID=UPI000DDB7938|nr:hypothetical protein [Moraxella ovis]